MPSSIAHILIAHNAYKILSRELPHIGELILNKSNHYRLGSLGPDLPSYRTKNLIKAALEQLIVRPFVNLTQPQKEDASFFFHSIRPNLFPYYLMEMNLAFAELKNNQLLKHDFNVATFVFTLGFVTHIAADQVIHRLVREITGPYYRSLEISQKHSNCEVHQDIFLFYELYPDRTFDKMIVSDSINIKKFGFEYERFCNLISLAISKAGYPKLLTKDIDAWIDGIIFAFDMMDNVGPYVKALESYNKNKNNLAELDEYKLYFKNTDNGFNYMKYYDDAVKLSIQYMKEIIRLWEEPDFSFESFIKYQRVIRPEDLTSPFAIFQ